MNAQTLDNGDRIFPVVFLDDVFLDILFLNSWITLMHKSADSGLRQPEHGRRVKPVDVEFSESLTVD